MGTDALDRVSSGVLEAPGATLIGSKRRHVAQVNFVHAGRGNDYRVSGLVVLGLKGYWEPGVPFALALIFGFGAAIGWLWDELQ